VRLLRDAGVNLVTGGVFAGARVQPGRDVWEFSWLDRVMDLLGEHGIAVDLATATASPPPWLTTAHPEMLPVDRQGHVLHQGARQAWSPSSPVYREHSLRLVERMAQRYADHPALSLWHVSNELGCHNGRCYSDASAAAFRRWLRDRYGDLDALNAAWGTAFWSQRYRDWTEIEPPRVAPTFVNPTQQLDFARFSSDALREQLRAECEVLRRYTPDVPITTNFMVMGHFNDADYARWTADLDLVANDHYMLAANPDAHVELSFCADHTRGLAGGEPWMLMESSTSAVSWQPVNTAKSPEQLRRNSFAHLARGADAVCFFQWRASRAGAEKYHSGMVPHAGEDSDLWRSVVALGRDLQAVAEVSGSRLRSDVAIVLDYENWWAVLLDAHPSSLLDYRRTAEQWYRTLWSRNIPVDVVPRGTDLSRYRVVVLPLLYLVDDADVESVAAAAQRGAHVLVTYFSGIVDGNDHVRLGGYPGAFRDLLGVRVDEFRPLLEKEQVSLVGDGFGPCTGSLWTEPVRVTTASSVAGYVDGPAAGFSAISRRTEGNGASWYVSTELDEEGRRALTDRICSEAGVAAPVRASAGVEVTVRHGDGASYLFGINHTDREGAVESGGTDLLTGRTHEAQTPVPAGGVVVLRTQPA
jgi:beta-galactosidase